MIHVGNKFKEDKSIALRHTLLRGERNFNSYLSILKSKPPSLGHDGFLLLM